MIKIITAVLSMIVLFKERGIVGVVGIRTSELANYVKTLCVSLREEIFTLVLFVLLLYSILPPPHLTTPPHSSSQVPGSVVGRVVCR